VNTQALIGAGPYHVIYADPPWPGQTGMRKQHYPSMTKRELLSMSIGPLLAADDCLLAMWSTWLHLDLALTCIDAWGFTYRTGMPWVKTTKDGRPVFGLGIWFRGCSELLLIATRGRVPNPRPARRGLVMTVRERHSKKPNEVRQWLAAHFKGPRLEMFAREHHDGWICWGDEL
jgi:N6-adenosine-specific RNA methylase IME4